MRDEKVAFDDLEKLVETQITSGINGLLAVGTTGESPTLSHEEHKDVITCIAKSAGGRVPVLAGTGSNSTREAVWLTKNTCALEDVAGALVVGPYYNKPSQEGLFHHFSEIAETTDKPIILYSIPGRCGIDIGVDTCARLYEKYPHVCGIKEAGGRTARVSALRHKLGRDFLILSGDDGLTLPFMSFGAKGVVSVASNIVVKELVEFVNLALNNDFHGAAEIEARYYELFEVLFVEPNPAPAKTAMAHLGLISSPEMRLPLCPMSEANRTKLLNVLKTLNLS